MKFKIAFLLSLYLLFTGIRMQAQNRSINFEHGSFAESVAKSKATGKPIFFDAYTSWCIPCQMMLKQVFTVDSVADYFNTHFINVKFDMEKGEGISLSKQLMVNVYPTFFILDTKGEELFRIVGSRTVTQMMGDARNFSNMEKRDEIRSRFAAGERDKAFLTQGLRDLFTGSHFAMLDTLMKQLSKEQGISGDVWLFFRNARNSTDGRAYRFVFRNRKLLTEKAGVEAMDAYFSLYLGNAIGHIKRADPAAFNEVRRDINQYIVTKAARENRLAHADMAEGRFEKDLPRMLKAYQSVLILEEVPDRCFTLQYLAEGATAFGNKKQCEEILGYVQSELKRLNAPHVEKMFEENQLAALRKRIGELNS
jgi:thiol-disulfide isomerase/thioredoxin